MEGDCNVYAHSSLWMHPTRPDRYNMRMVYIGSNSMVMHSKYIVGPRSMSKSNMQLEDVFWNSIPDTRAQAAGSSTSCGSYIAACWVKWAINPCFFVKRRIQFWQETWLEGDRNLAIITKTRFRFAESLAPPVDSRAFGARARASRSIFLVPPVLVFGSIA